MSIPIIPYIRYKADYFTNGLWNQSTDSSSSPKVNISISNSTITQTQNTIGYGVNKIFNVVQGTYLSPIINITNANITNYTLFSVARYNGTSKNRIITTYNSQDNGVYGFHSSKNGVAYHGNNWITQSTNTFTNTDYWILSTDYAYSYRCNGIPLVQNAVVGTTYLPPISINGYTNENSDYQIADIIIYDRQLLFSDIVKIESYLFDLYGFNGYYYNNTNLYSLYMPKLTDPNSNVNNTNFLLNDFDFSNKFQKNISGSGNSSYYITNTSDIGSLFQDVSTCIFKYNSNTVVATSSLLTITINGTNLDYLKKNIINLNNTVSLMTTTLVSTAQITATININTLSSNTFYSFTLYMFDSSNQFYDSNIYTNNFYTAPIAPTSFNLSCNSSNVITVSSLSGGNYSSVQYSYDGGDYIDSSTYTSSLYNNSVSVRIKAFNVDKSIFTFSNSKSIITAPIAPTNFNLSCNSSNVITVSSLSGGNYSSVQYSYDGGDYIDSSTYTSSLYNNSVSVYIKAFNSDKSIFTFSNSKSIITKPLLPIITLNTSSNVITVSLTGSNYYSSVQYSYDGGYNYINDSTYQSSYNTSVSVVVKVFNSDNTINEISSASSITTNGTKPTISVDNTYAYKIKENVLYINIDNPYNLTIISPTFTNQLYKWNYSSTQSSSSLTVSTVDKNGNIYYNYLNIYLSRELTTDDINDTPIIFTESRSILYILVGKGGNGGQGIASNNYASPGGGGGGSGQCVYGSLDNITTCNLSLDNGTKLSYSNTSIKAINGISANGQTNGYRDTTYTNTTQLPYILDYYKNGGSKGNGYNSQYSTGAKDGVNGDNQGNGGKGGDSVTSNGGGGGGGGGGYFVDSYNNTAIFGEGGYGGTGGSNGIGYGGGGGGGGGFGSSDKETNGGVGNPGNPGYALIHSYKIS
jgi:hypothetical protein